SVQAIGDAARLIRTGEADVAVCGGSEACIDLVSLGGFTAARALSTGFNSLQQQDRFDTFVREFNSERPHEALDMKCPAELYTASLRCYDGLPELSYPFHDRDVLVTACGRLCLHRKRI